MTYSFGNLFLKQGEKQYYYNVLAELSSPILIKLHFLEVLTFIFLLRNQNGTFKYQHEVWRQLDWGVHLNPPLSGSFSFHTLPGKGYIRKYLSKIWYSVYSVLHLS
jgi:hypothetical protein